MTTDSDYVLLLSDMFCIWVSSKGMLSCQPSGGVAVSFTLKQTLMGIIHRERVLSNEGLMVRCLSGWIGGCASSDHRGFLFLETGSLYSQIYLYLIY